VCVLGALFFILSCGLAIRRHQAFATGHNDLEIYSQVSWSLANGVPFSTTLLRANTLHLAEHLALSLLPLAPLYGFLDDPRLLLVLQQAALTLAALIIGVWARGRIGSRAGLVVLAACLLSPSFTRIALDDFHAIALTVVPICLGLVLALAGYPRSASLLVLAAALMEEEAALAAAGLGLLLIARGRRTLGAGLLSGGAVLIALTALVIMPGFHDPRTLRAGAGTRSAGHFSLVRERPGVLVDRVLGRRGQDALVDLALPTGGLALLSPTVLGPGLPTFVALFLQDREDTYARHWSAPILPALWLATVAALTRLHGRGRRVGLGLLIVGSLLAYGLASPLPGGGAFAPAELARGPRELALERAAALVPPTAAAAVSANVAAHLTGRRELYVYPVNDQYAAALGYEKRPVETYVLDLSDPATQRVEPLGRNSPLVATPPFIVQSTAYKILVLSRFAPAPEHPLDLLFGKGMACRGYDVVRTGDSLRLTLYWERTGGISADFRRNVELLDSSGRVLAENGELELTRTLPTQKWQDGQQVRDEVELAVPPDAGSGLRARVQWLNRDQRRPILLQDGATGAEIPI
jgi:uncharacterized membrane protein